jgi:2-oxoglutarate dehydrogenase E2 component (dihydrolipoamide succinyltransferase)
MSTELIVPTLGESITEATVSKWLKNIGDNFEADEPLVEIETDKITVEVPAPHAGSLKEIKVSEGTDVEIGGILGILDESKGKTPSPKKTETNFEISDLISIEFMKLTYVLDRYISVLVFQLDF